MRTSTHNTLALIPDRMSDDSPLEENVGASQFLTRRFLRLGILCLLVVNGWPFKHAARNFSPWSALQFPGTHSSNALDGDSSSNYTGGNAGTSNDAGVEKKYSQVYLPVVDHRETLESDTLEAFSAKSQAVGFWYDAAAVVRSGCVLPSFPFGLLAGGSAEDHDACQPPGLPIVGVLLLLLAAFLAPRLSSHSTSGVCKTAVTGMCIVAVALGGADATCAGSNNCDASATCRDTVGSFSCVCDAGYANYTFYSEVATWTDLSTPSSGTPPAGRHAHGFAAIDGKLYVHGGFDGSAILDNLLEYDVATATWTNLSTPSSGTPPTARLHHGFAAMDGMLYVHSGADSGYLDDLHVYNITNATWTELSTPTSGTPPSGRREHGFAAIDGKLYVYAGLNNSGSYLDDLHAYDIDTATWTDLSTPSIGIPPSARTGMGLVAMNGKLYVQAGRSSTGASLDDLYEYDIATTTWTNLSTPSSGTPPPVRYYHGLAAMNGMLYVHGGNTALDDLYEYNITTATWTDLSTPSSGTPPSGRREHGFAAINSKLYVHGGNRSGSLDDLHEYVRYSDVVACSNIDECSGFNDCHANANCTDTNGSFTCTCNTGYSGNGTSCPNIDECVGFNLTNCHANATCTDTDGSFTCACDAGFSGSGTSCSNIDECVGSNNCDANANCTDTEGSFTCTCNTGYSGSGDSCSNIDECVVPNVCQANATCTDTDGSFTCGCDGGFQGTAGQNCTACAAGEFKASLGEGACLQCAAGTYSWEAAAACIACPANSESLAGSANISDCVCRRGYTGSLGAPCSACPRGSYKGLLGFAACRNCSVGTYAEEAGATTCMACSDGSYALEEGESSCSECAATDVLRIPQCLARGDYGVRDEHCCWEAELGCGAAGVVLDGVSEGECAARVQNIDAWVSGPMEIVVSWSLPTTEAERDNITGYNLVIYDATDGYDETPPYSTYEKRMPLGQYNDAVNRFVAPCKVWYAYLEGWDAAGLWEEGTVTKLSVLDSGLGAGPGNLSISNEPGQGFTGTYDVCPLPWNELDLAVQGEDYTGPSFEVCNLTVDSGGDYYYREGIVDVTLQGLDPNRSLIIPPRIKFEIERGVTSTGTCSSLLCRPAFKLDNGTGTANIFNSSSGVPFPGLQKGHRYHFAVIPQDRRGFGRFPPFDADVLATYAPGGWVSQVAMDVPAPPEDLALSSCSPGHVVVTWSLPRDMGALNEATRTMAATPLGRLWPTGALAAVGGAEAISRWRVQVSTVPDYSPALTVNVSLSDSDARDGPAYRHVFSDLEYGRVHFVRVAVETAAGLGGWSNATV
eukprot:CAMPEP_0181303152 /NCGR_PEP_ID=MMETSP1101-20121128/8394_1 /TAXON_ID=46948 /ORGANISM="Rhodomonas abbreviata, Strain Caron Lab Isolate" /LENGTH=1307 /DNA_ID=CAMNT_0023408683 /DNA_START=219 /DNA_END=4139 /DNA_ORIENTATION=+